MFLEICHVVSAYQDFISKADLCLSYRWDDDWLFALLLCVPEAFSCHTFNITGWTFDNRLNNCKSPTTTSALSLSRRITLDTRSCRRPQTLIPLVHHMHWLITKTSIPSCPMFHSNHYTVAQPCCAMPSRIGNCGVVTASAPAHMLKPWLHNAR